jgi:hypothetical protein
MPAAALKTPLTFAPPAGATDEVPSAETQRVTHWVFTDGGDLLPAPPAELRFSTRAMSGMVERGACRAWDKSLTPV